VNAERETTRIVRSWLEDGATELPDRVLDTVLDQLPTTPQRRATWWPARRLFEMNKAVTFGVAAAAVVAVALIGINLFGGQSIGGPDLTEATPSPSPTPTPSAVPVLGGGAIEPGTYRVTSGSFTRMNFTLTLPAGWSHETNYISKGNVFEGSGVTLATWLVSHVYADSCRWEGTLREVGSTAELADALAEQTGHETAGPTEVTLGGYPATRLDFSLATDFDVSACDSEFVRLWPDAGPNENYGLPIFPGQTTTVYVVDLDGEPMLVIAIRTEDSSAADVAELEHVVESIRFQP
jgi:hypothetical protein